MRSTKAFLIGAGTAYVVGRLARHSVARATEFLRPRATESVATDDTTIEERILNEAFPEAGVSPGDIEVSVEAGVAAIQGSVDSSNQADALVERVASVPGVHDVAAMLRIPGDAKAA